MYTCADILIRISANCSANANSNHVKISVHIHAMYTQSSCHYILIIYYAFDCYFALLCSQRELFVFAWLLSVRVCKIFAFIHSPHAAHDTAKTICRILPLAGAGASVFDVYVTILHLRRMGKIKSAEVYVQCSKSVIIFTWFLYPSTIGKSQCFTNIGQTYPTSPTLNKSAAYGFFQVLNVNKLYTVWLV